MIFTHPNWRKVIITYSPKKSSIIVCDVYITYVLLIGSNNQFQIYKCEYLTNFMVLLEQV